VSAFAAWVGRLLDSGGNICWPSEVTLSEPFGLYWFEGWSALATAQQPEEEK
jgi:hypothetical protein